jgi:hypothetical protein
LTQKIAEGFNVGIEVTATSVSTYMTPDELEITGEDIQQKFLDAVETFRPFLDFPFTASGSVTQSQEIKQEPSQNAHYSIDDLANQTGFDIETLKRWKRGLERKGQAIFYGPPGTGKTFIAEKLTKHLVSGTAWLARSDSISSFVFVRGFHAGYPAANYHRRHVDVPDASWAISRVLRGGA